jgi:hypothetical protein
MFRAGNVTTQFYIYNRYGLTVAQIVEDLNAKN